jgi:hypothetical protein
LQKLSFFMKKILLLLFVLISSTVFSQTQVCPDVVCINTQDQDYFVLTTPGSTYNWQLSGGGVIQSAEATDTDADGRIEIIIDWGAVIGSYTIQVTETNASGCVGTPVTCIVDVVNGPNVTINAVGPFCAGDPVVNLVGNPAGGVFSGTGVFGNTFDPSFGSQTVTYTYNDPNGCSGSTTINIVVNPIPNTSPIYRE